MLRKSSKFLILSVVIAAAALFAAVEAGAATCPVPILTSTGDCPASLEGTCCATIHDPVLNADWVVEVVPDDVTHIFPDTTPVVYGTTEALCTDNKGNDLGATGFTYKITPPIGGVLTHAAVTIPAPNQDCEIGKICPKDNSTKFDSSFNGWAPAASLWVAGTSSIKVLPDDKNIVSFGTTVAGADRGTIHFWTSNGELEGQIYTPTCCEPAHVKSSIEVGGFELTFDTCTGDLITSLLEDGGFIPVTGFFCDTESDGTIIERSCSEAQKSSGDEALFMNLCIQYSDNFGIEGADRTGKMTTLIGYGLDLFLSPVDGTSLDCSGNPYEHQTTTAFTNFQSDTACQSEIVYDGQLQVIFDCGDQDDDGVIGEPLCICDPPQSTATLGTCGNAACTDYAQLGVAGFHIGACFNDSIKNKGNVNFDECSLVVDTGGATWSNRWGDCRWGSLCGW